jgi:hypothetical protein
LNLVFTDFNIRSEVEKAQAFVCFAEAVAHHWKNSSSASVQKSQSETTNTFQLNHGLTKIPPVL